MFVIPRLLRKGSFDRLSPRSRVGCHLVVAVAISTVALLPGASSPAVASSVRPREAVLGTTFSVTAAMTTVGGGPSTTGGKGVVPSGDVTQGPQNGGATGAPAPGTVLGGGGVEPAVTRIEAQLPRLTPKYTHVNGESAISYIRLLVKLFPQLRTTFTVLDTVGACTRRHGLIGVRSFIASDRKSAGAVLVVSQSQLSRIGSIALQCLQEKFVGGGPTAGSFKPCMSKYAYDSVVSGVTDHYYLFIAGTSPQVCRDILLPFSRFSPKRI